MKLIIALALMSGCLSPSKDDGDSGLIGSPDIEVSPSALDFGTVFQLSQSTASINVANLGTDDLSAELSLGAGAPFGLGTSAVDLAPGEDVDVEITVYPEDFGSFSDTITISSNDPDEPVIVVTLSASVDADNDGDGFGPAEDCDDDDASVYPGAEDDWYDGVDSDCEGDDDFDADTDGHQSDAYDGDDCDDSNPDAYPGNEETWYDGVDGDCDGRDDYDADGDGYAGDGGADCDDTDEDVNPGTLEVADDGIDNDCDSAVDEDLSGDDVDGDGFSELDGDCNDTDATIYPSATETWYDGVDQDCDGASDYDADVDGFDSDSYGGDDCDDDDAGVNPDAAEVYYDGVDANCDGADDYDADSDGYGSTDYGGDDCDDLNSSVNPGVAETWYDGADSNCDGADDYDADGDGYTSDAYGGDDCDDAEASAYPGGADTWYDGIDGDCAGDSDYDADGDGEDHDSYGGVDCDDSDAAINTSALEYCDGVDTDCSGTADDDYAQDASTWYADADADGYGDASSTTGACSQPSGFVSDDTDCDDSDAGAYPGAAEVSYDGLDNDCDGAVDDVAVADVDVYLLYGDASLEALANSLLATPDLNADGDPELIIGSANHTYSATNAGTLAFFDADVISTSGSITDAYSLVHGAAASDGLGFNAVLLGDVDGDGNSEVAVSAPYSDAAATNGGAVYIFDLGTGATHGTGNHTISPDGELQGGDSSEHFGTSLSVGDFDGDGSNDLATGGDGGFTGRGRVQVHTASDGYATASDLGVIHSSAYFYGPSSTAGLGTSIDMASDVTGNGYDDLVACGGFNNSGNGRCWVVEGRASPALFNQPIQSHDIATIGGQNAEELGMNPHSVKTTDVDGDGQADVVVGAAQTDSGSGAVYVFFGGSSFSGNFLTQSDEDIAIAGDGSLGHAIHVGDDVDGDGTADILLGAPTAGSSAEGVLYMLSGSLSSGSFTLPDDQSASWMGENADDAFGSAISGVLDVEGDGQSEFAVAAPGNDNAGNNKGAVYVVPTY